MLLGTWPRFEKAERSILSEGWKERGIPGFLFKLSNKFIKSTVGE